jgi:methionine--tRNA ligase beta chain
VQPDETLAQHLRSAGGNGERDVRRQRADIRCVVADAFELQQHNSQRAGAGRHVDIGETEPRSIVAGIALAYKPEELVGRKVVIVANLAPRKLSGLTSQGMIVAASREGDLPVLATFTEDVPPGARLK